MVDKGLPGPCKHVENLRKFSQILKDDLCLLFYLCYLLYEHKQCNRALIKNAHFASGCMGGDCTVYVWMRLLIEHVCAKTLQYLKIK